MADAATAQDSYILFTLAGTSYAMPSPDVRHIEMVEHVTGVPNAPPFVDGVVFSRGEVVPVVNLRARFGLERAPYDERTRLLVVQAEGRTVGLLADAAREFVAIPASMIHPPHEALRDMSGKYLRGIATLNERMVLVLDTAEILRSTSATGDVPAVPAARS
jgi:purine-binding chemotaxis protein CheW